MSSRMVWVSLLLATSLLLVLFKSLFLELLPRLLLCHLLNTPEVHRIFQVVSTVLLELSPEDTHSKLKLRTQKLVTVPSMLRSKTDVVPCLVFWVLCAIPNLTPATTTSSTLSPTTRVTLLTT